MGKILDNIKSVFNTTGDTVSEAIGNISSQTGGESNIVFVPMEQTINEENNSRTVTIKATYNELKEYFDNQKIVFTQRKIEEEGVGYAFRSTRITALSFDSFREEEKRYQVMTDEMPIAVYYASSPDNFFVEGDSGFTPVTK